MSEDITNGATNGAEQGQPAIAVNVQFVKDLSFENPNAPQSLIQQTAPSVDVRVDVGARQLGPNVFEVQLTLNATAKHEDNVAFIVELTYGGVFTVNVPQEHLSPVLLIECPRLLFPFARAIVADAVRDGGFPPLMIQPIDFVDLFRRRAAAAEQEAAGQA